ncbi:MAG: hypothetical protein ACYDIC_07130 [Desulfobaccales bacterium]
MKTKFNARFLVLGIIGAVALLLPFLHLAQAKEWSWQGMKDKIKIIKDINDLNLGSEKEAALLALNKKYAQERKQIIADLKKYQGDLEAALAAAPPDEEKIKNLISAANSAQDKLLANLKMQRDEALALMTPVQQAQLLVVMGNWAQKMLQRTAKNKS